MTLTHDHVTYHLGTDELLLQLLIAKLRAKAAA